MSEPMSSGEIEDVLSSIRRLVSEDLRPAVNRAGAAAPLAAADAARAAMADAETEKLILTPALRVVEAEAAMAAASPGQGAPSPDDGAEQGGAQESGAQGWGGSDEPGPMPAFTSIRATPLTLDESLRSDLPGGAEDAPASAAGGDGAAPESARTPGLGAVLSSIGSAVDQNRGEWESETGDSGFGDFAWKRPDWANEADHPAPGGVTGALQGNAFDNELSPAEAEAAEAAARAEIEAAEREAAGDDAAGRAGDDSYSSTDRGADMRGGAQGAWFPGAHAEPLGVDFDDQTFDEGGFGTEAHYDEALLRDLVRDILREELSGTLGERITRNVRKLVHAEIARALATRDLD